MKFEHSVVYMHVINISENEKWYEKGDVYIIIWELCFNAAMCRNAPYFYYLLCLMPDNFTRQGIEGKSLEHQWLSGSTLTLANKIIWLLTE
jgi:hypothetical protein